MIKGLLIVCVTTTSAVLGSILSSEPAPAALPAPVLEDATYLGSDACKKCHFKQHKTWGGMKHAEAWEVLPEKYRNAEAKDANGAACISCHVTGWEQPGGFVDVAGSANLLGVGCEACHGPGSRHVELGQVLLKEKRKELAPGEEWHVTLKTTNCSNCHNPHVSHAEYLEG